MTTISEFTKQLFQVIIFSCLVFTINAQDTKKIPEPPQRPKFSDNVRNVNVPTVDSVVTLSFTLLKSMDDVSFKMQGIEGQLQGTSTIDASSLLTQIDDCSGAINTVTSTSPALIENIADMIANIKDLHIPLLKIPSALRNLNEARKAIQYSVGYAKYLAESAIPNLKNTKPKTDSTAALVKTTN